MNTITKIIIGLKIFEKYNSSTIPYNTGSKAILIVQEEEFKSISKTDREELKVCGWENSPTFPYEWRLHQ